MKKILIFTDYHLPGYKGGGVVRENVNAIERLGERYDFHVLTRGFDIGEKETYPGIALNDWNQLGKAKVFYAGHGQLSFATIRRVLKECSPDVICLTSFFSPLGIKFLTLRRLGMTPDVPVILVPNGEFSPGALSLKATKKKIFRTLAFPGKLYSNLIWKAASELEKQDIERVVGTNCEIHIAPSMTPRVIFEDYSFEKKPLKKSGAARLVFLSRVVRKKNVLHTLELLAEISGEVIFDIYGPLEDEAYWQECKALIDRMPDNIKVCVRGSIPHDKVAAALSDYHFFVMPTLGENFGHVFLEAFAAGCPLLISDKTPWRDLEAKNLGWDLPLERQDLWRAALQECVEMDGAEFKKRAEAARLFVLDWLAAPEVEEATAKVLDAALARGQMIVSSAA